METPLPLDPGLFAQPCAYPLQQGGGTELSSHNIARVDWCMLREQSWVGPSERQHVSNISLAGR